MDKVGIYFAYWTHSWEVDFHPYIDKAAQLGFDVLEVNGGAIASMTSVERLDLKSHADDKNIVLSFCIGLPSDYDIASEYKSVRENGIEFLKKLAGSIGEIGGGNLGGIIYGCWPASMPEGDTDKQPYVERSIASMRQAIKTAEDNNVFFNMEVVNRFEQFIINTSEEAVAYVDAVDSPNARVMLDTFHMNIEENFISDAILRVDDKLGHLHVGENNRMLPGYGHIPWTELANSLRKIDYQGYVVMEPFVLPGGEVGRDIKVYRDLSIGMDLDEEARKALQFIRGVLKSKGS